MKASLDSQYAIIGIIYTVQHDFAVKKQKEFVSLQIACFAI